MRRLLDSLLVLWLLTGSCMPTYEITDLPARVQLNEHTPIQDYLVVPDDTTSHQLENLLHALSQRSPILGEKYGLEPDMGVVFVFRERDREVANWKTLNEMSRPGATVPEQRSYYGRIAARYTRFLEGGEIGTIGSIKVEHEIVILRGPGAKESYDLLKKHQIPDE